MAAVTAQRRASTPRPSISPLSTASKAQKRSPNDSSNMIMADPFDNQEEDMDDTTGRHGAEAGDDDRSSSLSEPEDDDEEEDHVIQINGDSASLARDIQDQVRASVEQEEDDSEAETERLDQTPQKLRARADGTGRTPSKLSQAARLDEELSDPPSPIPAGAGAASSTSTVALADQVGQKRKRSADTADSPLTSEASSIGESPRKRSHGLTEPPTNAEETDGAQRGVEEEEEEAEAVTDTMYQKPSETPRSGPASPSKGTRGRKGKGKGKKGKEVVEQEPIEAHGGTVEQEDEWGEGAAVKTEADVQQKEQAAKYFDVLAQQFVAYRELLYNERIAAMTEELKLLDEPKCEHPEYLRQVAAIDARREKQIREAQAHHFYKMQALRERTLGERSQLHSQYVQHVRDLREQTMEDLGKDWYSIQKERRQSHQEQSEQYQYRFPTKKSEQIRQQAKYNQEVSVLSGVAKYVGFPAAPEIDAVEGDALDDDLKAMKIPKQRSAPKPSTAHHHAPQPQPQPQQSRQHLHTVFLPQNARLQQPMNSERLAHDQFIEQNAWARPQMPLHSAHGTPNLTHTPDWAEPQPSTKHLIRNLNGAGGGGAMGRASANNAGSPFQTPLPNKRAPIPTAASDGPEPPSSAIAAPPTSDRLKHHHYNSSRQASPLQVPKRRHPAPPNPQQPHAHTPHHSQPNAPETRNYSNISGTSTIDASNPPSSEPRPSHSQIQNQNPHHPSTAEEASHHHQMPKLPLPTEGSAPLQAFNTSQLHRVHAHGSNFEAEQGQGGRVDTYASVGFRAREGAFGTPVAAGEVGVVPGRGSRGDSGGGEGG